MNRLALLGAAAVIAAALVGGLVLIARPSANVGAAPSSGLSASAGPAASSPATPPASPVALDQTFTSSRYGYSVAYPSGWTTVPATKSWPTGLQNNWLSGYNDEVMGTDVRFSGASQRLPDGQTADQWLRAYGGGVDPATWTKVSIAGVAGYLDADDVPAPGGTVSPGGRFFDVVTIDGRWAYNFDMDGKVDRATFDAFLATVILPSVPTPSQTFISARHGISIAYPAGWTVRPATRPWQPGTEAPSPPSPSLDVISDPADASRTFVMVSQPLGTGTTPTSWLAAYERSAPQMPAACWPSPDQMEQVTIGGLPGWIHGGVAGCGFTEAVVFAGGRVYELSAYGPVNGVPYSRPLFYDLLATVRFDPASANDHP